MLRQLWAAIGGDGEPEVRLGGPAQVLPSVFDVTGLATAVVGVAGAAAAAHLVATAGGGRPAVTVDSRQACAAFLSERLLAPVGWTLPAIWDPLAGDYPAAGGWIRLHTNYAHHRRAVRRVLGGAADRNEVAARVRGWDAVELESAVVAAGGCAAAMHDRPGWLATPAGEATAAEPVVRLRTRPGPRGGGSRSPAAAGAVTRDGTAGPYAGVRVLDLTRVIAGPVATRFLAAYGAQVLRVDPPGFAEVPALLPDTTAGKRCTALDLATPAGRRSFDELLAGADVLVCGLRADAATGLGYSPDALAAAHPHLITARLDAYGWTGPWRTRRGFDSLVQLSTGIAAAGAAARGADRPVALPAQALDHATGYLLAAAIGAALTRRARTGAVSDLRCSLVATANLLLEHPVPAGDRPADPVWTPEDTEPVETVWGPARRVPIPGRIDGHPARTAVRAGPLGRDLAAWSEPHEGPGPDEETDGDPDGPG
jgi:hypothetical protein